jgi:hypothetical protein
MTSGIRALEGVAEVCAIATVGFFLGTEVPVAR